VECLLSGLCVFASRKLVCDPKVKLKYQHLITNSFVEVRCISCTTLENFVLSVFTRDSIYAIARICYRPSVRPSVTLVDHTKTVEDRIMKFSPYGSPIPLVFLRASFIPKF